MTKVLHAIADWFRSLIRRKPDSYEEEGIFNDNWDEPAPTPPKKTGLTNVTAKRRPHRAETVILPETFSTLEKKTGGSSSVIVSPDAYQPNATPTHRTKMVHLKMETDGSTRFDMPALSKTPSLTPEDLAEEGPMTGASTFSGDTTPVELTIERRRPTPEETTPPAKQPPRRSETIMYDGGQWTTGKTPDPPDKD